MNKEVMFSSKTDLWGTPQDLFDELDAEFHFDLDVCALPDNAKCKRYYTPEMDGLWCGVAGYLTKRTGIAIVASVAVYLLWMTRTEMSVTVQIISQTAALTSEEATPNENHRRLHQPQRIETH